MRSISSVDIVPFFKEKGVNEICECCGKDSWVVHNDAESFFYKRSEPFDAGMYLFPVIIVECTNCGNLRIFSRRAFNIPDDTGGHEVQ
ncbi:MAG: hypothetical protein LBS45_08195 [Synergistaceae bacterium]|jgi:hypothetical protein|nr:hypothetical protein [Synergistaceae bacterium]